MNNFSYEGSYYIIHSPLLTYYQRLWSSIYAPVTGITEGKYTLLFNNYLKEKKARHACLVCNIPPTNNGYIVYTSTNPGTAKYVCEVHCEIFTTFEALRKL